jgi:hypothetical protein
VGDVPKGLPSGQPQPDEEFSFKNAEMAFGPNSRPLGWYRWASWFAQKIHESGVLPDQIKTHNAAFAVLCKGDELGLPPFAAWNLIYFTKAGRLALMSKGALAVVQSKPTFDGYKEWLEGEGETLKACAAAKRKGQEAIVKEFSHADADTAKLLGPRVNQYGKSYDSTYDLYEKDMLLSRVRARVLDIAFAAELGGIPIEGVAEDIDAAEGRRTERPKQATPAGTKDEKTPLGLPPGRTDPLIEELKRGATKQPEPVAVERSPFGPAFDEAKAGLMEGLKKPPAEPELLELAPGDVKLISERAEIERSVDEAFGSGAPDSAQPGPEARDETPAAAGSLSQDPVVPKSTRPICPKCGKRMHRERGCDACFMKERAAREASGQKSAPPCPRCGTALNAMNGCDVCGYPGEADFR